MTEGLFLGAGSNAVGTLMVDYLVKPIERRIRYLFRSGKIVEELRKQKNTLNREQIRVKNEVEEAKLQNKVIEEYVDEWLINADNALKDVEGLESRVGENKKCCRWCPNFSWRYRLSKEMDKKTLHIDYLVQISSKFELIGHRADLPNLEFMPSNDVVASKSSTVAFNKMMDALKDEEVKMIGVWGMGGVGKTTLVTQVGHMVKELRLFSKVIIVVVSQTQSIENIQNKIADCLHLKFEKTTLEGKANELWLRLEKKEKVLIILDDMWNELNLKDIGIPLAEKGKGCKIILTTRNKRVCDSMKCQVTVPVDLLGGEEEWDLFKMKANLDETRVSKDIIEEAKKVAEECKGLPVAIVTLASALKRAQTKKDWEFARKQLERSRLIEIGDIGEKEEKNAYACIETSYKYLKTETTKRCFLLCALYPEDYLIDIEELVRYAWGLQLYANADSVRECRIRVLQAIEYLKDSCLLLDGGDGDGDVRRCIKLHDMVRDVALWIASKEESGFLIKSRLELLNVTSEPCNAISLLNSEEKKFPERLMHPKLEIMLLNNCDIQGTCFQGMGELKVLSLSVDFFSLKVISLYALTSLQKLHTLILKNFVDVSFLGNLKTLEILCLRGSIMDGLEDELGGLENLKILDLTNCRLNSMFPHNIIRRMSKLEELYLKGSIIGCDEEIKYNIAEINSLSRLTALSLKISYEAFRNDFEFLKLERYDVSITGEDGPYCADLTEKFWIIKGTIPLKVFSLLPENLEWLDVSNNLDLTDLSCVCELPTHHARLEGLVYLRIFNCPSLKSLFPLSLAQSLVLLEMLEIAECHGLMQIVTELEGDEEEISLTINSHNSLCFPKLKKLKVENCDGLEYIFPTLMAPEGIQGLRFTIKNCHQLKQVIKIPEDNRVENNLLLQQLQSLRSLQKVSISGCPQLTGSIVHLEAQKARLKKIRLSAFEESFSTSKHLELSKCNDVECLADTTTKNGPTYAFTHLEILYLLRMDGLESLCKGQPPQGFLKNLIVLYVSNCKKLQVLFQMDEHREENQDQPLSNLQSLKLEYLPELRWILRGSVNCFTLPSLTVVKIVGCSKLESLFSPSLIQSLELLEELKIESCPELKTLFGWPENDGEVESESSSRPLCLPKLKTLEIHECSKLEYVVPITLTQGLPSLESVSIEECGELKTLFGEPGNDGKVESESSSSRPLCLPKLKTLKIHECSRLEYVVPITLAQGLPALVSVSVEECDELKTLFEEPGNDGEVCLPKLKILQIRGCSRLEYVVPMTLAQGLPALESVSVFECGELKTLFREPENDGEVESESSSSRPRCFPKLKTLDICVCSKLEYVVPITLAQGLPALKSVSVKDCGELKQVLGMAKEEDGVEQDLHLPSLQDVSLQKLKSLTSFVPDKYTVKAPALKTFKIYECPKVMKVPIQQELNKQLKLELRGTGLSVFKELSCNTKVVILNRVKDLRNNMVPDIVDLEHLDGLTSLHIDEWKNCKCLMDLEPPMPKGFLTESQKLEEGLCNRQETQASSIMLSNLEHLELRFLPELRWIIKGPTHCFYLQGLKHLRISVCHRLESLFSVSVVQTLRSLEELNIYLCHHLKSVFRKLESDDGIESNTLCSLPNLKTFEIKECPSLEYVFPLSLAPSLPRLQEVHLRGLRSLSSLVEGNNFLEAPALEILDIQYCPAFQTHVNNCSTLKKLVLWMRVRDDKDAESCNMINTQLRQTSPNHEILTLGNFCQLFQLQGGDFISSLEIMDLQNSFWLRDIWKGPIHVATNLRELKVNDCYNLTYIFPVMLIPHLPQLSFLKINSCRDLKQIIANDDISASSSSQGPQLEKKMIFPRLKEIVLENLSRVESFSPVGYHLEFPCLELLVVSKCLKMVTSFTVDYLTFTVHAQTHQASQLDDVSPSQENIVWRRRRPTLLPQKKMYVEDHGGEISL